MISYQAEMTATEYGNNPGRVYFIRTKHPDPEGFCVTAYDPSTKHFTDHRRTSSIGLSGNELTPFTPNARTNINEGGGRWCTLNYSIQDPKSTFWKVKDPKGERGRIVFASHMQPVGPEDGMYVALCELGSEDADWGLWTAERVVESQPLGLGLLSRVECQRPETTQETSADGGLSASETESKATSDNGV